MVVQGQDLALWVASPLAVLLAAILTAIVEAAKRAGFPNNLCPWLAIALGVVGAVAYVQFYGSGVGWRPEVGDSLIRGLVLGLMAGGVFSLVRATSRVATGEETIQGVATVERRNRS